MGVAKYMIAGGQELHCSYYNIIIVCVSMTALADLDQGRYLVLCKHI